jgi:hypothetical protein
VTFTGTTLGDEVAAFGGDTGWSSAKLGSVHLKKTLRMDRVGDYRFVGGSRGTGTREVGDGNGERGGHDGLGDPVGEQVAELADSIEMCVVDGCWGVCDGAGEKVQGVDDVVVLGHCLLGEVVVEELNGVGE